VQNVIQKVTRHVEDILNLIKYGKKDVIYTEDEM
jgi:hypothetical protein